VDLVQELAELYLAASEKTAEDPAAVREQFEESAGKERAHRTYADKLRALAARRSAEEDTSPKGYLQTGVKRLAPVPHTGGEAVVRGLGGVAGGILGHHMGQQTEKLPAEDILKTLTQYGREVKEPPPAEAATLGAGTLEGHKPKIPGEDLLKRTKLMENLEGLQSAGGVPETADLHDLLKKMRRSAPEDVATAVRARDVLPSNKNVIRLRNTIKTNLGSGGRATMRRELENVIGGGAKGGKGLAETAVAAIKPRRLAGAAGGVLAGSVLAGLPFAVRALLQKRHGGEAAVAARNKAEEETGRAESEAAGREKLLGQLKTAFMGKKPDDDTGTGPQHVLDALDHLKRKKRMRLPSPIAR